MNKRLARALANKKGIGFMVIGGVARWLIVEKGEIISYACDSKASQDKVNALPDASPVSEGTKTITLTADMTTEERDLGILKLQKLSKLKVMVLPSYSGNGQTSLMKDGKYHRVLKEAPEYWLVENDTATRQSGDPLMIWIHKDNCVSLDLDDE